MAKGNALHKDSELLVGHGAAGGLFDIYGLEFLDHILRLHREILGQIGYLNSFCHIYHHSPRGEFPFI